MESVYKRVLKFQKKFPNTVGWRTKEHCSVVQRHLNPGENIIYAFILTFLASISTVLGVIPIFTHISDKFVY